MAIYIVGLVVLYAVVVAIIYFVGGAGAAAILGVIFAVWLAVEIKNEYRTMKNIERVVLADRTDIYKSGLGATGFSLGFDGKPRILFGNKNSYERTDVSFFVYYTDKQPQKITVREGSKKYQKLLSYAMRNSPIESSEPTPSSVDAAGTQTEEKPQEKKYYIDIPFEVLPNEVSLQVSFPSCQIAETDEGKSVEVRFEASYDTKVKSLRDQRVTCAVLDSRDRIVSVIHDLRFLNSSGTSLVQISFRENIEEDPVRVRIGLEEIN